MGAFLVDNKPRIRQFRHPRRAKVSGVIVLHTAENVADFVGTDTGAESVAKFIQNRSDYGSYHFLADRDSHIHMVPLNAEAYGDGTGSNTHAIHISWAVRTVDWARMSTKQRDDYLRQGAKATAKALRWLKRHHNIDVPLKRISRAESERRVPGFLGHGDRDPGRRSDPGANFPWAFFFAAVRKEMQPKKKKTPRWDRIYERSNAIVQREKPGKKRKAARRVRRIAARHSTKY